MRRNYILLLLISLTNLTALAQVPYGNEWIDHSKPHLKVKIIKNGIYRIHDSTMVSISSSFSSVKGSEFKLFNYGVQVPIYVSTQGNLNSGDYIEFYATLNDGRMDADLYDSPSEHSNPYYSLFTDTNFYYITWNSTGPWERMDDTLNDINNPPLPEDYCLYTVRESYTSKFYNGPPNNIAGVDLHTSDFGQGEGWGGSTFTTNLISENLTTPNYYNPGSLVDNEIEVAVCGVRDADHRLRISLNGSNTLVDTTYSGYRLKKFSFTNNINLTGTSTLNFQGFEGNKDQHAVYYASIRYPRDYNALNKTTFEFSLLQGGERYIEVSNMQLQSSDILIYDFTNKYRLTASQGNPVKFKLPDPRTFDKYQDIYMTNTLQVVTITDLETVTFVDYSDPANQGDYIIISHDSMMSGPNYVEQYKDYRNTTGYQAIVVNINQLYDQFGYGVPKHPLAIRNFSNFSINSFDSLPKYVFLIGKAAPYYMKIVTRFSFRKPSYYAALCLIPTYGIPESDNQLTAPYGSSFTPQIPIGRLAATTPEHVRLYLQKVKDLEMEQNTPSCEIDDKLWMKHGLHFGGGTNQPQQDLFAAYLNQAKNEWEDTLYGGKIFSFFKTSSAPIQQATSERIL
ncbi:MAG: hypothetical protein IH946_12810, partial [Bacteroidetes bacterium]|nr:hypothetical protein [Bacteroidota bacterium]